jgi:hypothetical protein
MLAFVRLFSLSCGASHLCDGSWWTSFEFLFLVCLLAAQVCISPFLGAIFVSGAACSKLSRSMCCLDA